MYAIFGIDLLHEVEVGTWKALLLHLLRLLVALGGTRIQELNSRYVQFLKLISACLTILDIDKYPLLAVGQYASLEVTSRQ
jgi:hypothetical protein